MPSLEEIRDAWGDDAKWSGGVDNGDGWSEAWGSVEMQWYGSILPRIQKFLPNKVKNTEVLLEIAPGYGRWTQFLINKFKTIYLVDINENCITACKKRFYDVDNISYFVNDGKDLSMIPDRSVDFVFSFDSMVHAEIDVLDSYLKQLAIKLKIGGKGFIHHSNIGKYIDELEKGTIVRHWRAKTVTAEKFKKLSKKHGMHCESQELFNWGNKKGKNTDCFSVFRNVGETANTSQTRIISSDFMIESRYLKNLSTIY